MEPRSTMLLEAGEIVADRWTHVGDGEALPPGEIIVSLDRLTREVPALLQRNEGVGVLLPAAADIAAIAPWLPQLRLVAIAFPTFRDGRGFSLARALREQNDFRGEIRAVGHLLPDQVLFLARCGVSTVEIRSGIDGACWRGELRRFRTAYQPAADSNAPLSPLRRHLQVQAGGEPLAAASHAAPPSVAA
jgi:uncharacterized protein (DUF934 family)